MFDHLVEGKHAERYLQSTPKQFISKKMVDGKLYQANFASCSFRFAI